MREYELYMVIDGGTEDEEVSAIVDRITELIALGDGSSKGEVIKVEPRGKRRLAYPIKNKTESQDVIVTFLTPPQALAELERFLKLSDQVLRHLIVRTEED
jgi:small subunit ribosomal protein S6